MAITCYEYHIPLNGSLRYCRALSVIMMAPGVGLAENISIAPI